MNEVAGSLGQRLRAERERQGLSAQKAADALHLDPWVVDALEADDYSRVGPSVYVKGHLKRYAEILGLPPAEIVSDAGRVAAAAPESGTRVPETASATGGSSWRIGALVGAVVVVAALAWARPWVARPVAPTGAVAVVAPTVTGADLAGDEAASQPAVDSVGDPTVPGVAVPGTTVRAGVVAAPGVPVAAVGEAVPGAGRTRLRLSFSGDSWVEVWDAAGARVFAGRGRANSVKSLSGTAPLRVYLGSVSGVQLEINNHTVAIGSQYVVGNVAHFEAGADGVLRRDVQTTAAARPHG